jgi:hypothetical protein
MTHNELYSYHVFLFPFQWHYTGKEFKGKPFEDRTNLTRFSDYLTHTPWKPNTFELNSVLNYNEYNYFYDFVRDILYDEPNPNDKSEKFISNYFYDIKSESLYYKIKVRNINKSTPAPAFWEYKLLIDSIILNLYSTGVGVLSFHLCNREIGQSSEDDILRINQYGRRLYPPFFAINPEITGTPDQFKAGGFEYGLENSKGKELADAITIGYDEHIEDFSRYNNSAQFNTNPFQLPNGIKFLFEGVPLTVEKECSTQDNKIFISPLLDDRMFVQCWYGNDDLAYKLAIDLEDEKHKRPIKKEVNYGYKSNEWWYKYLFIDGGIRTCQNGEMTYNFIKDQTNDRWIELGTLYGISRYSFMALTGSLENLKDNNAHYLINHMQTMYYKMVELCLVQRACILRFSDEVTHLSSMKMKDDPYLSEKVSSLYKQYIRFINKIYFREVTAQEQGIELYNLLQKQMQLEKNVKCLDEEIQELHNYVLLVQEKKQNRNIELITLIGAMFVVPTYISSFLGMNLIPTNHDNSIQSRNILILLIPLIIGPIVYYLFIGKKNISRNYKMIILFIVIIGFLLFYGITQILF